MDIRLALMCGTDIPVTECQLVVHQPTFKEISYIGEQDFLTGIQCLCLNKTMFVEDKKDLANINNFQIFMTIMKEKEAVDKKKSVLSVLQLLCPKYKPIITPQSLILQETSNSVVIDEKNFESLQYYCRKIFCMQSGPMDQQTFNPANKKAKEIADKIMKGRQKVAEIKGASNTSIFSQYLSILAIALQQPLSELINMTMFQLYDLVERYQLYLNWDLDIKQRLAGGKPDNQPDNWMKNIHTEK